MVTIAYHTLPVIVYSNQPDCKPHHFPALLLSLSLNLHNWFNRWAWIMVGNVKYTFIIIPDITNKQIHQNNNNKPLTLLIAKRLLQHGEYDRVVQNKVAEVTGSRGTQSGVANQCVFIQQTAGRGGPTRWREGTQHLHNTEEHHTRGHSVPEVWNNANWKIRNHYYYYYWNFKWAIGMPTNK